MTKEAIILAGGFGTRLRSVVNDIPKPMAPVNGKPFLEYLLQFLKGSGYRRIILSVGYKHEVVVAYFGSKFNGVAIEYAVEKEALGTGGGIRLGMEMASSKDVLVLNGDTFFNVRISNFEQRHKAQKNDLTMAMRRVKDAGRYGAVMLDQGRILSFEEKRPNAAPGLINGGLYLVNRQTFLASTSAGKSSFETDFLQAQITKHRFGGYVSEAYFIDIGIPEDYQIANAYFKSRTYR